MSPPHDDSASAPTDGALDQDASGQDRGGIIPAELHRLHDGLTIVRMMAAGELPISPMAAACGVRLVEVSPREVLLTARADGRSLNIAGAAHGGWVATLLDCAVGLAALTTLPAGRSHTTVELSVRYLRAITPESGLLHVRGMALSVGRRMATAEGKILDTSGRLLATAATSCLVLEM